MPSRHTSFQGSQAQSVKSTLVLVLLGVQRCDSFLLLLSLLLSRQHYDSGITYCMRYPIFCFFCILQRMGKNKAQAHHTSTYFHARCVSIKLSCFRNPALAGASFWSHYSHSVSCPYQRSSLPVFLFQCSIPSSTVHRSIALPLHVIACYSLSHACKASSLVVLVRGTQLWYAHILSLFSLFDLYHTVSVCVISTLKWSLHPSTSSTTSVRPCWCLIWYTERRALRSRTMTRDRNAFHIHEEVIWSCNATQWARGCKTTAEKQQNASQHTRLFATKRKKRLIWKQVKRKKQLERIIYCTSKYYVTNVVLIVPDCMILWFERSIFKEPEMRTLKYGKGGWWLARPLYRSSKKFKWGNREAADFGLMRRLCVLVRIWYLFLHITRAACHACNYYIIPIGAVLYQYQYIYSLYALVCPERSLRVKTLVRGSWSVCS